MRIAYLDCLSGISGDMFLGALLDIGVPFQLFQEAIAALNIGARLEVSRVNRSGIAATKADVLVRDEKELPREVWARQQHEHKGDHAHGPHTHTHPSGEHNHGRQHLHPDHGRSLTEIKRIISQSAVSESAKKTAIQIFECLGAAEAKIHNTDIEAIHFHEVGAIDAMVDIVCAAVGSEALAIDEWVCSPLNVGGGTVKCAHGTLPVPAPATLELLKHAPVYSSGIDVELVTPTGAAIVKTLVNRFSSFPKMRIEKASYGAGTRELAGHPNVLRLTIGEEPSDARHTGQEIISVLQANLDDLNPQVFGYVLDRLLEQGALDVFAVPVQMKKSRPGTLLSVLCLPEHAGKLSQIIFAETTTLGIRRHDESREVLSRRWVAVETRWGSVRMKVGAMNGTVTNFAPEYEDCRRIAAEHHVPLKSVMQEATRQYVASNDLTAKHGAPHDD